MLDPLIQIVLNHKPQAISKETYQAWKDNPVTRQLLFELAEATLDVITDELPDASIETLGGIALMRESARATAMDVINWTPSGEEA